MNSQADVERRKERAAAMIRLGEAKGFDPETPEARYLAHARTEWAHGNYPQAIRDMSVALYGGC